MRGYLPIATAILVCSMVLFVLILRSKSMQSDRNMKYFTSSFVLLMTITLLASMVFVPMYYGKDPTAAIQQQFEPSLAGSYCGMVGAGGPGTSEANYIQAKDDTTPGLLSLEVLYGTDRKPITIDVLTHSDKYNPLFVWSLICLGGAAFSLYFLRGFLGKLSLIISVVLGLAFIGQFAWAAILYLNPPEFIKSPTSYGGERADEGAIQYGTCQVNIPKEHRVGKLESPSVLKFEINEDPNKHVVLMRVDKLSDALFYGILNKRLDEAKSIWERKLKNGKRRDEVFIFVHGYNVSFEDAARRTAQLAYDLDFHGVPLFFSWPSRADTVQYTRDENESLWTTPHLAKFIREISQRSQASSIHLIAHSMGNRCMLDAIKALASDSEGLPKNISEVILAAPDVDADTFKGFIPNLLKQLKHVTLYASSKDKALLLSKGVHGYARAGDAGDKIVVVPPMDTIDASALNTDFLGHSYFGDHQSVVADIYELLVHAHPPAERFGMKLKKSGNFDYFLFSPR